MNPTDILGGKSSQKLWKELKDKGAGFLHTIGKPMATAVTPRPGTMTAWSRL